MAQQELLDRDTQAADVSHVAPDTRLIEQPATNPLMLLQQAVDRGMSPEQLKALVDLHEQWRAARAREAFNAAMTAVQIQMPCAVRDAENKQTNSRYIRLETLSTLAKPIYTAHGFALSFSEADSPQPGWKRIVCHITHIQGHGEQRFIDLPVDGIGPKGNPIGGMNAVQGAISTGSYGQRVLTCRIFNITVADTDLDGDAPNPPADSNAPKAQPRGKREAVSKSQFAHITAEWESKNLDPNGDREAMKAKFWDWAKRTTGNAGGRAEWSLDDYHKCCAALSIPTLEDLERDAGQ